MSGRFHDPDLEPEGLAYRSLEQANADRWAVPFGRDPHDDDDPEADA